MSMNKDSVNRLSKEVCQAANWFISSLLAGDFGPHASRDSRSDSFLKHPQVVGQAVQVFLESLQIDGEGSIINHDEAEQHAGDIIRQHCR